MYCLLFTYNTNGSETMNSIMAVVIIVLFVVLVMFSLGVYFFVKYISRDRKKDKTLTPKWMQFKDKLDHGEKWLMENTTESITKIAADGTKLNALYIKAETKKFIVFVHGYRSSGLETWGCQAEYFNKQCGYNVLIPDLRACGKSGGKYAGFGVLDRYDILMWIKYLTERFGNDIEIALEGVSMGGAAVLMTSGFEELPENVKCVVADCAFTSPYEIFKYVLKTYFKLPCFPILNISSFLCRAFAGYGFKDYSTLSAMEINRLPVLFIHGKDDNFVPTYMSRENYKACKSTKKLLIVEKADHAISYYIDTELVTKEIEEFLNEYVK